jgi:RimJ/RimL family protein N-acetyltransferase
MKKPINLHTIPALQEIYIREGVKLRLLDQSHAARLLEILEADSIIRDNVTVASRMHTQKDVANEIDSYHKDEGLIRYVLMRDDNPIGLVSLWRDDGFWGKKNLDDYGFGYFLDQSERGKGLVTSAIQSLMDIVVKNLEVNQFVAFCEDLNKTSIAVLSKLGFRPTEETFSEPNNGWIERKYIKPVK